MSAYTDLERPPLRGLALRRALVVDGGLWTRLDVVTRTGSTNADVAAAARDGAAEGLVVVAEHQDAGRGRSGRTWSAPPRAGIAVSVLLRPGAAARRSAAVAPRPDGAAGPGAGGAYAADAAGRLAPVPPARYGWLPLLAGVALVEAVTRLAGVEAALKWPNDLLVGGCKCAGVLAEATGDAVVLGVGLNVTQRVGELPEPPSGAPSPISLTLAGAGVADRDPLLRELLRRIESWYLRWRAVDGDAGACGLRAAYVRHCATVDRRVRVLLPGGGDLAGMATTVDADGRLVLLTADGDAHAVAAGDVEHVREG